MPVLEDFHVSACRRFATQALGQLHGTMMRIVVPHETAGKSDQNVIDLRGGLGFDSAVRRKNGEGSTRSTGATPGSIIRTPARRITGLSYRLR